MNDSILKETVFAEVLSTDRPSEPLPETEEAEGWKEAAIGWEVCGSVHRKYARGKDTLFETKQEDYVRHAEAARQKYHSIKDKAEDSAAQDPSKPRTAFLNLALASGAILTGTPGGREAITVVFSIGAWQAFDKAVLRSAEQSRPESNAVIV